MRGIPSSRGPPEGWRGTAEYCCQHNVPSHALQLSSPIESAVPGGWGDIAVVLLAPTRGAAGWALDGLWNAVGLADILLVVATAARLAMADPASMRALTRLPLSLLPSFLVPMIIATHVIIFARLLPSRREDYRAS